MYNTVHYPPTPGGSFGGATERGGQPQQGAVAGVKMVRPVWSLSLSMLTDLWWSPKSSMKNFGSVRQRHRTRCAQVRRVALRHHDRHTQKKCLGAAPGSLEAPLELHQDRWRLLRGAGTPVWDVGWPCPGCLLENCQWRLRNTRELTRKDRRDTVEQLRWGDANNLLRGGSEAKEQPREVWGPVRLGSAGTEGVL